MGVFQMMFTSSNTTYVGRRTWRCNYCRKTDRKGRLIWHIYQYHVDPKRIPFTCGLCGFICQDRQTLRHHLHNYKRHVEIAEKTPYVDLNTILKKAASPYWVTERDMTCTKAGVSLSDVDPDDDPFQPMEDEAELPAWLLEGTVAASPTPASSATARGFQPIHSPTPPRLTPTQVYTPTVIPEAKAPNFPVAPSTIRMASPQLLATKCSPPPYVPSKVRRVEAGTPVQDEPELNVFQDIMTTGPISDPAFEEEEPVVNCAKQQQPTQGENDIVADAIEKASEMISATLQEMLAESKKQTSLLEKAVTGLETLQKSVGTIKDDLSRVERRVTVMSRSSVTTSFAALTKENSPPKPDRKKGAKK